MPGIPREEAEHSLDLNEKARPIKQRLRRFAQDRKEAIRVEVTRLLAAGFIREVTHPKWLANPVLVKKKNGEWRMCVDYTDLNKHRPKDPFPLSRIDQVVDSTAECTLLSFLDCYSSYHQIALKKSDQEKTSFITPFGAYCYNTMMFGLKNAGATTRTPYRNASRGRSGATPRLTWMTSSSRLGPVISSLPTYKKHLKISGDSNGSSTPPNASSVSRQANYSAYRK